MPRARLFPLALLLLVLPGPRTPSPSHAGEYDYWKDPQAFVAYEKQLVELVDAKALRAYHDLLASRPHRAGTDGDQQVVAAIAGHFRKMGLEVEQQELHLYLCRPVAAELEIVAPQKIELPVREAAVDDYSKDPNGSIGWNAYSGSGEVSGEVVYANYGRKEDFEKLKELGVDVAGKIVIARYGGNFRGYKAKFAEAAGAIGLIIYTDPADSGWGKGVPYPEGGYANGTYIQRGSILTLNYRGDPLTPGAPASEHAQRLDPKDVALPKILCQPVGWDAASQILARMKGDSVSDDWQGGLPFRYRLWGGEALKVRLMVKQERKLTRTWNVTGKLLGATSPEQFMVVGCHHDAWGFGAGDPLAGTILVLEAARCFSEAAREGRRPQRSIVFAAWAAEEFGIIGSTEWVEGHARELKENCIAYLNLDMAAMGPNVLCAAAPLLKPVIDACVEAETGEKLKKFGDLGGGSDHIGFYCHLGIPSAGLGAGGAPGVSYHSLYDNLAWYRKIVGDDYASAKKLARIVTRLLARVTDADLLPLRPSYGQDMNRHLEAIEDRAGELELAWDFGPLVEATLQHLAREEEVCSKLTKELGGAGARNAILRKMERTWLGDGLPGRPFFRSLYAAPDEDSGYAAWMLPGLRYAVEHKDEAAFKEMALLYRAVLASLRRQLDALEKG